MVVKPREVSCGLALHPLNVGPGYVLGVIKQFIVGDIEMPSSFLNAYFRITDLIDIFLKPMETRGIPNKLFPTIRLNGFFHKYLLSFKS